MKTLQVTWRGVTPLIMHSCRCVNPLHPLTKEMKKLTGKRTKTDDDYEKMADYEWLMGAYYTNDTIASPYDGIDDDHTLYVPAENIMATIVTGGKAFKKGTDIKKFVEVVELEPVLILPGNPKFKDMLFDYRYRHVNQMVVNRSRVTRTRPRFSEWAVDFTLQYDEAKIDVDTIVNALEYAGQYVGLCDSRPRYGKFAVIVDEIAVTAA